MAVGVKTKDKEESNDITAEGDIPVNWKSTILVPSSEERETR